MDSSNLIVEQLLKERIQNIRQSLVLERRVGKKKDRKLGVLAKKHSRLSQILPYADSEKLLKILMKNNGKVQKYLKDKENRGGEQNKTEVANLKFMYSEQLQQLQHGDKRQRRWHPRLLELALGIFARSRSE